MANKFHDSDMPQKADCPSAPCSGWVKRRPRKAGEYLIAIENTSAGNPGKSIHHAVLHESGELTTPVLYDGTQPNIYMGSHLKIRGWMVMPAFPNV